jgi:hypothetical protein
MAATIAVAVHESPTPAGETPGAFLPEVLSKKLCRRATIEGVVRKIIPGVLNDGLERIIVDAISPCSKQGKELGEVGLEASMVIAGNKGLDYVHRHVDVRLSKQGYEASFGEPTTAINCFGIEIKVGHTNKLLQPTIIEDEVLDLRLGQMF